MSAILETLSRLNQAVDKLEQSAAAQEQKAAGKATNQQDLFTALSRAGGPGPVAAPSVVPFDAAQFTRKLDMTIRNVEALLKEG